MLLELGPLQRVVGIGRGYRVQCLAVVCLLTLLGLEVDRARDFFVGMARRRLSVAA
jgi:hypothetical protein